MPLIELITGESLSIVYLGLIEQFHYVTLVKKSPGHETNDPDETTYADDREDEAALTTHAK